VLELRHGNALRRSGCGPLALGRLLRRLEEPSPKSFLPLTSSFRPRAPSYRFQAGRQLPPRARSTVREDGFTRLTRIVPPSSSEVLESGLEREWRNDPRRLLSYRCPVSSRSSTPRYSGADLAPCGTRRTRARVPNVLRVRITLRTPIRSRECLYTHLCGVSYPRAFPASAPPRPKPSSFSEPTAHRVSGEGSLLRASSLFLRSALRLATDNEARCVRPTSASYCLTTSTRASSATGISSRLTPRPWPSGLHPRPGDRWTWRFTTPDPLRQASIRVGARHVSPALPIELCL